jgi:hypothetical protein
LSVEITGLGYDNVSKMLFVDDLLIKATYSTISVFVLVYISGILLYLLIVPGVLFFSLFCYILIDTSIGGYTITQSMRRSWQMTKGRRINSFLTIFPCVLLVIFIPVIISSILGLFTHTLVSLLVYFFTLSCTVVYASFVIFEVYVDIEGYAVEKPNKITPSWVRKAHPMNWDVYDLSTEKIKRWR